MKRAAIAVAALAGLVWFASAGSLASAASKLQVRIVGLDFGGIIASSLTLKLRLKLRFINPSNTDIPIEELYADCYVAGSPIARVVEGATSAIMPLNIPRGSDQTVGLTVRMPLLRLADGLISILQSGNLPDKALVKARIKVAGIYVDIEEQVPFGKSGTSASDTLLTAGNEFEVLGRNKTRSPFAY